MNPTSTAGRDRGDGWRRGPTLTWQAPGPVTPGHPLQCLIVLPALRQSDGDWWIDVAPQFFLSQDQPIAWAPDTPDARAALDDAPLFKILSMGESDTLRETLDAVAAHPPAAGEEQR